jgi:hypothetical protein
MYMQFWYEVHSTMWNNQIILNILHESLYNADVESNYTDIVCEQNVVNHMI